MDFLFNPIYKIKKLHLLYFFAFLTLGTIITFYPTLFTFFRNIQSDIGDPRFCNYLLEHSFLWIKSNPLHNNYWNLPIFYPIKNTLAYSDMLLGPAPIYWILRLFFLPDTSYQLWLILVFVLNYTVIYIFLSKYLKYSAYPSSIGSFIFTYSIPRTAQLMHAQLLPEFFIILSLFGLCKMFSDKSSKTWYWSLCFFLGILLQIITGVYLAFFWCLSLIVTFFIIRTFLPHTSIPSASTIKIIQNILILLIFSLILLFPVFLHYYAASKTTGFFDLKSIYSYLPHLMSWFYTGHSFVYSRLYFLPFFQFNNAYELVLNIGYVTTILVIYTALINKNKYFFRLLLLSTVSIMSIVTIIPFTEFSLWEYIAAYLPFVRSVRVMSRIVLILLIPVCIWIAEYFQNLKSKKLAKVTKHIGLLVNDS